MKKKKKLSLVLLKFCFLFVVLFGSDLPEEKNILVIVQQKYTTLLFFGVLFFFCVQFKLQKWETGREKKEMD